MIYTMVDRGAWILGDTYATIRNQLRQTRTALFDEKDWIPEKLLNKRFKESNSGMILNRATDSGAFIQESLNINGWTIVASRKPFKDVALMSRCLVISPRFVPNPDSRVIDVGSLSPIVDQLGEVELLPIEGRALQVWRPLITLAVRFGDTEWIKYAGTQCKSDMVE